MYKFPFEIWILFVILSILIIIATIGIFFILRKIKYLNIRQEQIKRQQKELKQQAKIFSHLGEDIFNLSKSMSVHTTELQDEVENCHLEKKLETVIDMENQIVDSAVNLLNFLKLKANNIKIENRELNINKMLDDVMEGVLSRVARRDVELVFEMGKSLPQIVRGDYSNFVEVMQKLLVYAINTTSGKEVRLRVDANCYDGLSDLQIHIYFIPNEKDKNSDTFFTPSYDEKSGEYRRLGLYVASEIIKLLGGSIKLFSLNSKEEISMVISIPLECNEDIRQKSSISNNNSLKKSILIFIENYEVSFALKEMLEFLGCYVVIKCIDELNSQDTNYKDFDILIINENILDEELKHKIQEIKYKNSIKVIALNSLFNISNIFKSNKLIDTYINNPFTRERLYETISNLYKDKIDMDNDTQASDKKFIRDYKDEANITLDDFAKFNGGKLLVVEDNEINIRVLLKILSGSGIEIATAKNGLEAVEYIKSLKEEDRLDLVLMDINMPIMDGYEATQKIRELPKGERLPIVALSALNLNNEIDRMQMVDLYGFIEKPIRLGKLYSVFELYLPTDKETKLQISQNSATPPKGIDWEGALENIDNNEALLEELLCNFVNAYKNIGDKILKSYEIGDDNTLREIFLDLLGLTGSLGANELHNLSKSIYWELRYDKVEDISKNIKDYIRLHNQLIENITDYFKRENSRQAISTCQLSSSQ